MAHCGMVELDELVGVVTFVDAVREKRWDFYGVNIIANVIAWYDIVSAVWN